MKKIVSLFLLVCMFCSQFQVFSVFAESETMLDTQIQTSTLALEKLETLADTTLEKIEQKTKNPEIQEQIQEKQAEIEVYLETVQEQLQDADSSQELKETLKEAKKVVLLKVVSGSTEYENTKETIGSDVASTPEKQEQAFSAIQDSLETKAGVYSLIIKTRYDSQKLSEVFSAFDTSTKLEFLYELSGEWYYEVFLQKDSLFREEMLTDIESGILPESFIGIDIIVPEVYGISEVSLAGENLEPTWGIGQYKTFQYFEALSKNTSKIRVGVVDTGIDYRHPDLANNVNQVLGKDFVNEDSDAWDDQGHGTHVAGTIAANINAQGIIGVNPYVELVPLKICNDKGFCPSYAVIRAIDYAREQKIDILNMSLGGKADPQENAVCTGIASYTQAGGIVIAASGNSNVDTSTFVPGGCSEAVTVAAVDITGKRAVFSNYGTKVDVAAPGVDVYSTYPLNKGSYKKLSGTSMATPHIVGLVSVLQSYKNNLTTAEVKTFFKNYGNSVQSDTGKYIAQGVDIPKLMTEISRVPDIVPELALSALSQSAALLENTTQTGKLDEALLDTSGIIQTSTQRIQLPDTNSENTGVSTSLPLSPQILNFGNIADFVNINSEDAGGVEVTDISEREEAKKSLLPEKAERIYDTTGKEILSNIEINDTETFTSLEAQEQYSPSAFTQYTYTPELITEAEQKTYEVFLPGAKKDLQINSSEEIGLPVTFPQEISSVEISSGKLLSTPIEIISAKHQTEVHTETIKINSAEEDELVPELTSQGFIKGFSEGNIEGPISQEIPQTIDFVQEATTLFQNGEIFIDGAEKPIQINSADEEEVIPEVITPEIYDPSAPFELKDEIDFSQLSPLVPADSQELIPETFPEVIVESGVIETPEGIEFGENNLAEGEVIPGVIDNTVELQDSENIAIQNTYSCEIEYGQMCSFSISRSYDYIFTPSVGGIAQPFTSRRDVQFKGLSPGTVTFQVSRNGILYHTIYVTVKEPKVQQTYDITLYKGGYQELQVPTFQYISFFTQNKGGQAWIGWSSASLRTFSFRGDKVGKIVYYIFNTQTNAVLYKINVEVIPVPPQIINLDIYLGQTVQKSTLNAHDGGFSFTQSNSNIQVLRSYYNTLSFKGTSVGTTQVIGTYAGDVTYIYNITVKGIPVPKEYSITVVEEQSVNLYFPESNKNTGYSQIAGNTGYALLFNYPGYVQLLGKNAGTISYHIFEGGVTQYIIKVQVLTKAPTTVDVNIFAGQTYSANIKNASNYTYTSTVTGLNSLQVTSSQLYITGIKAGVTQMSVRDATGPRYIFNITVNTPPEPERLSIQTQELKTTTVFLGANMYLEEQVGATGKADRLLNSMTGILTISGKVFGNITYIIRDNTNLVRYIIEVQIIPEPPIVQNFSVFETREVSLGDWDFANSFTLSKTGGVTLTRNGYRITATANISGEMEIYMKNWQGRHTHTFKINVIAKPVVQVQSLTAFNGTDIDVYFPQNISYKTIVGSGANIFEYIQQYPNRYNFRTQRIGKYSLHFRDANNFDVFIVQLDVVPYIQKVIVPKGYRYEMGEHERYSADMKNRTIASFSTDDDRGYIGGLNVGETELHFSRDGGLRDIYQIQVVPTPEPTIINCTMYVGERCRLETRFKSLQFVTNNPKYITLEKGSKTIRIQGQATGTATVYVKGRDSGEHLTHIINIKIIAVPPEVLSCTIPAGTECQTRWYDDADTYMMTTSNKNITDISLYRYLQTFVSGTRTLEKTIIKGKTPGYAEVYIYKYGVHIGTVKTTVTAPVAPISISRGSVTLKEGEKQTLNITNGGGLYQKESGDESIANLRISSTSNTGTISITGMKYGQTQFTIKDQYFQTARFTARVEDTILVLSHDILELRSSNSEYISARESYKGIKNFTKSNENIRVIKKLLPDGIEVLEVFPERAGETILTVYDNQDNVDTVRVIVGGSGNGTGSMSTGFESYFVLNNPDDVTLKNILAFNVIGNYNEVGIEFKDENNKYVKQAIEKNTDGFYITQLDETICSTCGNSFTPYIIDSIGNTIYPNPTEKYFAFSVEVFRNIAINSGVAVASSDQETIEINTIKQYWKEVKLATTDVVIAGLLGSAVAYGQVSSYLGVLPHDLPISSYMLARFMNGDGGYDFYGTNHWISKELKLTSWYNDKKTYLKNNLENYSNLKINEELSIDFKIEKISDTFNSKRQQDFANSFGNIGWNMYVHKNNNGKLEIVVKIGDTYDFHKFKGNTFIGGNNLNGWAEYYQTRGHGGVYDWDLEIYELLN